MTAEDNKAIIRRIWEEGTIEGSLALQEEFTDVDAVYHGTGGIEIRGLEKIIKMVKYSATAFPDIHLTIKDLVAEGDRVVALFEITGTHQGEYLGIAPTGKQLTYWAIQIHRIAGGKVVEVWRVEDRVPMLRAIGALK